MLTRVEVIPARPEDRMVLENLMELYVHDFSEFVPVDVGEDGRFGYRNLARFWDQPDHHPFLARVEGRLAGFALVRRMQDAPDQGWDMPEFFVLRRYRRRGTGAQLAETIWNLCPGNWQVRVMAHNVGARSFWESAIARYTGRRVAPLEFELDGVVWHLFRFRSPGRI